MEGIVYMILNIENNKMYIGSTVDSEKRFRSHLNGLRGQYHENRKIQKDFNIYGEECFRFITLCETVSIEERLEIEESLIQGMRTFDIGYNLSLDGRGRYILTEETRKLMSKNNTGESNPFYGKTHSEESKEKISKAASKRIGDKNPFYGKKHTKETLEKIEESFNKLKDSGWENPQKGVPKKPEAVYNNMMAQPKRRPVSAEGREYPSISACAKDLGVVNTTIKNRIKNDKFPDYYFL